MAGNFDIFGLLSGASFAAGIAVLVVIAARLILKKAPKRWSYIMWAVVFFRCLCPFAAESSVSIFNAFSFAGTSLTSDTDGTANSPDVVASEVAPVKDNSGYVPSAPSETVQPFGSEYIVNTESIRSDSDIPVQNYIQNVQNQQDIQKVHSDETEQSEQTEQPAAENSTDSRTIFTIVWLCGVGAMALYGIVSAARLAARVKTAVRTEKGIYESDRISTAFAAGLIRPKIYIPCGIPDDERRLIVMHERVHIRRRDYLFKLLAFAGLSLHWFNPLIWAAFALMTRDMEMSCDEAVLKECGESGRILYAEALLRVSVKGFGGAAVVGFGETGIKERVKNVLNYKKQGKLAAVAAAIVMLASCTMAGTDAVDGGREDTSADSTSATVSADNENNSGNEENTEAGNEADNNVDNNVISEFFDRSITLSARESVVVIGSPEADVYNPKNVWLIPIDRTDGIKGMGAENFIIDDDGVVTATFRIHREDGKVKAPADGEVLWADNTCVVLDTEYGAVTYGDMKEVELKAGGKVVKGDTLGRTSGDGYTGYAVQASMSIPEAFSDVDIPISAIYYRVSMSNGAYTYTSSDARFLGDNADNVRLLETVDLYEMTPWYKTGDSNEFHGTSFSAFKLISDMEDGEQLRQKQGSTEWKNLFGTELYTTDTETLETDSKLAEQNLRLQEEELRRLREEEESKLQELREEEERLKKEAELRRQSEEWWHSLYDNHVYPAESADSAAVLVKPCPQEVKISALYGKDNDSSKLHKGIDYLAAKGTEVYAAADGRVIFSKYTDNGYGVQIIIDHGGELATLYAHLDEALVSVDDEVKAGDLIGYSGHTGSTYGDALHFEVRENGQHVDPMNYFKI